MKKRSAMLVAGSLVAALLAGGTALSFSLAGRTASAQDSTVRPIVETRRQTITIHKKAKAQPARVVTIASQPSTGASVLEQSSTTGGDDDREFVGEDESEHEVEAEHESGFEDGFGSPDAEDDGGDD